MQALLYLCLCQVQVGDVTVVGDVNIERLYLDCLRVGERNYAPDEYHTRRYGLADLDGNGKVTPLDYRIAQIYGLDPRRGWQPRRPMMRVVGYGDLQRFTRMCVRDVSGMVIAVDLIANGHYALEWPAGLIVTLSE